MAAAEKAAMLTNQMLAYAGKVTLCKTEVHVEKPIQEITALVRPAIPERIRLEVDVSPDLPQIEADPVQIQQVIMNLVLNASEAIGNAEGLIHISASTAPPHRDAIFIRVRDTGKGMDAQTRAKIFDPFFTTKFTGRGLGLAAVHGLVRLHDGTIDVNSAVGAGSTFTVVLPVTQPRFKPVPAGSLSKDSVPARTVLIVDDVQSSLRFAGTSLQRYGLSVLFADSGAAAVDLIASQQHTIVVALLDLSMPNLSSTLR